MEVSRNYSSAIKSFFLGYRWSVNNTKRGKFKCLCVVGTRSTCQLVDQGGRPLVGGHTSEPHTHLHSLYERQFPKAYVSSCEERVACFSDRLHWQDFQFDLKIDLTKSYFADNWRWIFFDFCNVRNMLWTKSVRLALEINWKRVIFSQPLIKWERDTLVSIILTSCEKWFPSQKKGFLLLKGVAVVVVDDEVIKETLTTTLCWKVVKLRSRTLQYNLLFFLLLLWESW